MAQERSIWLGRLKFGSSFLRQEIAAILRREPKRREGALAAVEAKAIPNDPASVLRVLDEYAESKRFLMNVGPEKGPMLEEIVQKAGPTARVLELGSFVGYSAVLMSQHLEPPGRLVSIDIDPVACRVSAAMAAFAGLEDRTEFHDAGSKAVIPKLTEPFDVVFLDHWKGLYQADMERLLEHDLLRPGAVVIADNLGRFFGDNPYLPWMQARPDFESTFIESHLEYSDVEDAVLVSRYSG
jgi:catechol O-methyltransferase